MRKLIILLPFHVATMGLLFLLLLVILFHVGVMLGLIPTTIVWGGRFNDPKQIMGMEFVSIGVNLFLMGLIAAKANYIKHKIPLKIIQILLYLFVTLFLLNTVGNLLAKDSLEKAIFTPITLVSAIVIARIAMEKE